MGPVYVNGSVHSARFAFEFARASCVDEALSYKSCKNWHARTQYSTQRRVSQTNIPVAVFFARDNLCNVLESSVPPKLGPQHRRLCLTGFVVVILQYDVTAFWEWRHKYLKHLIVSILTHSWSHWESSFESFCRVVYLVRVHSLQLLRIFARKCPRLRKLTTRLLRSYDVISITFIGQF